MTEPESFQFADDGAIPNSRLPLLMYHATLPSDPRQIEQHFAANRWPPAWRNGVHPYHHFHANTPDVLGVARGTATVLFGGPNGWRMAVTAGDVVVVPAGVGHRNMEQSPDLLIIGTYPDNAPRPDQYRGNLAEYEAAVAKIAAVPSPSADPVSGTSGPLCRIWGIVPA